VWRSTIGAGTTAFSFFFVNQGPSSERKKVGNGKMHDKEHDKQNINIDINVKGNWTAVDRQILKMGQS
jgi:hypothetical protein